VGGVGGNADQPRFETVGHAGCETNPALCGSIEVDMNHYRRVSHGTTAVGKSEEYPALKGQLLPGHETDHALRPRSNAAALSAFEQGDIEAKVRRGDAVSVVRPIAMFSELDFAHFGAARISGPPQRSVLH
jgi:hypothetical protein